MTSEESTTPDLMRDPFEAVNRRDLDAMMSFYAPDALWESPPLVTSFEGRAAIRGWVFVWVDGLIVHVTAHTDIDEGRAAAGRLAESRG